MPKREIIIPEIIKDKCIISRPINTEYGHIPTQSDQDIEKEIFHNGNGFLTATLDYWLKAHL